MTATTLYAQFDAIIGPLLKLQGFRAIQPAEYIRRTEAGEDRIAASIGPSTLARTHFAVFMSYYPDYLQPTLELIDNGTEDRGFPCGPYLTPVGVSSRPKYWSFKTPEILDSSLRHVAQSLNEAGLPWLDSLRDAKVFADNVDPVAALDAGLAHEAAGNIDQARQAYAEFMRRFQEGIRHFGDKVALKGREKAFVFLSKKLNVEAALRERLQRQLNYYPDVKPLP